MGRLIPAGTGLRLVPQRADPGRRAAAAAAAGRGGSRSRARHGLPRPRPTRPTARTRSWSRSGPGEIPYQGDQSGRGGAPWPLPLYRCRSHLRHEHRPCTLRARSRRDASDDPAAIGGAPGARVRRAARRLRRCSPGAQPHRRRRRLHQLPDRRQRAGRRRARLQPGRACRSGDQPSVARRPRPAVGRARPGGRPAAAGSVSSPGSWRAVGGLAFAQARGAEIWRRDSRAGPRVGRRCWCRPARCDRAGAAALLGIRRPAGSRPAWRCSGSGQRLGAWRAADAAGARRGWRAAVVGLGPLVRPELALIAGPLLVALLVAARRRLSAWVRIAGVGARAAAGRPGPAHGVLRGARAEHRAGEGGVRGVLGARARLPGGTSSSPTG